jgi:uncharacterized CHY-type Zn-finger protein
MDDAASMSEYLSSYFVDPVLRQARRLSRIAGSGGEESSGYFPAVPESLRTWYPTRLWNTSPPPSIGETDDHESGAFPTGDDVRQWATQMPSPPWEPMDNPTPDFAPVESTNNASVTAFPPLEHQAVPQSRPAHLETLRANSDHSLNPMRELTHRSRVFEDVTRRHARSDPISTSTAGAFPEVNRIGNSSTSESVEGGIHARLGGSGTLPEDDGMGLLRQKISAIWNGSGRSEEKAQRIHVLMMERYQVAQLNAAESASFQRQTTTPDGKLVTASMLVGTEAQEGELTSRNAIEQQAKYYNLTRADLLPSYAPPDPPEADAEDGPPESRLLQLGCKHYKRNVKMQCSTCRRWYTCRLCHDDVEDHPLPRAETKNMLCMLCNTPQAASQTCNMCGNQAACYYCAVCKLWNNDPEKAIYHCDDCGICRLGQGLGKDFFHCKTCVVCMSIAAESTHRCIEQSTKCDCPICGEYLFTSSKTVVFMRCGHAIHDNCFHQLCRSTYKCPICSKSVTNMESQFRNLDRHIAAQPMPEEYRGTKAYVYCNDCTLKGMTDFHWLGIKCAMCESYNTTMLGQLLDANGTTAPANVSNAELVDPSGPLPLNVTDEAVPIPNSRAASRRPSTAISDANGASESPWLRPQGRGARSLSPVVSNYFGHDRRGEAVSHSAHLNDEDDLDFWGRQSPRQEVVREEDSEGDSSDEDMDDVEPEDEDEEDQMDIFGHR